MTACVRVARELTPPMSTKEQAIASIQRMPDTATWAEISERVQILAAIEQAEAEIDAGKFYTQEQVEAHIAECLRKLSGPSAA